MKIYTEVELRGMTDEEILAYEEKLSEFVKSLPDTERVRPESERNELGRKYLRRETERSRYDPAFLIIKLVKEDREEKRKRGKR